MIGGYAGILEIMIKSEQMKCKKCKGTGRLWSREIPTLIGITQVSVKSCDCEAGIKRERRLNA